jgi:hypothetical protein
MVYRQLLVGATSGRFLYKTASSRQKALPRRIERYHWKTLVVVDASAWWCPATELSVELQSRGNCRTGSVYIDFRSNTPARCGRGR